MHEGQTQPSWFPHRQETHEQAAVVRERWVGNCLRGLTAGSALSWVDLIVLGVTQPGFGEPQARPIALFDS
jgi:hypothetical protein